MCEVAGRVFAKLSVAGILDTGHRHWWREVQSKDPPHTLDTNKGVCYILLDMSIDDGKSMCSMMLWLVCRQQ